jgi:hypothetical protein
VARGGGGSGGGGAPVRWHAKRRQLQAAARGSIFGALSRRPAPPRPAPPRPAPPRPTPHPQAAKYEEEQRELEASLQGLGPKSLPAIGSFNKYKNAGRAAAGGGGGGGGGAAAGAGGGAGGGAAAAAGGGAAERAKQELKAFVQVRSPPLHAPVAPARARPAPRALPPPSLPCFPPLTHAAPCSLAPISPPHHHHHQDQLKPRFKAKQLGEEDCK